ncbi:transposase [Melittangium boletus DSM 14713]|uniref:Transposase n=1 Tax=Melittangium boletus DSM 14713 TaxID=1294270 RepID=A0A286NV09_9BACT|nr:transposase [Melittangium boletus DSM 14713]
MHLVTAFLSHAQAFFLMQQSKSPLSHPSISSQMFFGLDFFAGDAGDDMALAHALAHIGVVIPFVAMSLLGTPPGSSARTLNGGDGIQQWECLTLVVHVGCRQQGRQRQSSPVHNYMMRAPCSPSVRRIRTCACPLFWARTLLESNAARLQSSFPWRPSSLSNRWCNSSNTPAFAHSRSLLQHVTPLQPKTSPGRSRQASPVLSTKTMPLKQARSSRNSSPCPVWTGRARPGLKTRREGVFSRSWRGA